MKSVVFGEKALINIDVDIRQRRPESVAGGMTGARAAGIQGVWVDVNRYSGIVLVDDD